jgi:hypothetical protein
MAKWPIESGMGIVRWAIGCFLVTVYIISSWCDQVANRKAELALSGGPSTVFLTMNINGSWWRDQMANRKAELALSGGPAIFLLPCISLALGVTKWSRENRNWHCQVGHRLFFCYHVYHWLLV